MMPKMMSKYIYNLIEEGEHQKQDFKFEISDAKKIARTLVAFSNSNGGKLLIGVKDNGKITGIRSEEEYYMLESASSLFCKPNIDLSFKRWVVEGKVILEVDVAEGSDKPYKCLTEDGKWLAYIREDDENFLADTVQYLSWTLSKKPSGILLKYTDKEQLIIDLFKSNSQLNMDQIRQKSGIRRRVVIEILAKLVSFELIDVVTNDKGTVYVPGKEYN